MPFQGRAIVAKPWRQEARYSAMPQNRLYFIIGALVVIVIAFGIYVWREESKPDGVEIRLDESGISVEQN